MNISKSKLESLTKEIYSALSIDRAEEILKPYIDELRDTGLRSHADHSQHGYDYAKFVEGAREKWIQEWSTCKMAFCRKRYEMVFEKGEPNASNDN